MSPPRRPPPPQSPTLLSERERERDLASGSGVINSEGRGGSSSASLMPSSSPSLQRQRSPGPVKFGPPPPPPSSTSTAERERASTAAIPGLGGSAGSSGAAPRSSLRPGSPVGQIGKAGISQPLVSPRIGLAGPGRAGTPGPERRRSFTSPSSRSVNGIGSGVEGEEREREKDREKDRVLEEPRLVTGPGVPTSLVSGANASSPVSLAPPSKMAVPQMVDGP